MSAAASVQLAPWPSRVFDPRLLGPRIRAARKACGMHRAELAYQCGASDGSTVSKWERGECVPSSASLALIALTLKVSADHLLFGGDA